jgi:presequence protease
MKFISGETYNGFKLDRTEKIDEIKTTVLVFSHVKSGARLIKLENENDNRVFSISFRTPVDDNTGVPHIIEHSVLCGSEKFDTKEPFVELAKGSLNTFLNAFTFPDKTMYPVASKNEKDFFNLMNVYLDAVFHPKILSDPLIMMQEGWHYELDKKEGPLVYKGVVFNEMKGAFSSPNGILMKNIQSSLFPDTSYFYESGGNPEDIPSLTYGRFKEFHARYYHPSNSYVFLYGNGDTVKELEFIDGEYLSAFDRISVDSAVRRQPPFAKPAESTVMYPILENETAEGKYYFSMNYALCETTDPEMSLAFAILDYVLLQTPASPLKKALLDAGIAEDVYGFLDDEILQLFQSVVAKNARYEDREKFVSIVTTTLEKLVKEGIDRELTEGAINRFKFLFREANYDYPEGLYYNMLMLTTWLYDSDPVSKLKYESIFKSLEGKFKEGYLENLIKIYFLENCHRSTVVLKPEKGLLKINEEKTAGKLAEFKNGLDDGEIVGIINNTVILKERQSKPDSVESLDKIPLLTLGDISRESEKFPVVSERSGDVPFLYSEIDTRRIAYYNLMFFAGSVGQEDINYLALLAKILGKMDTKRYKYYDLSKIIDINFGDVDFHNAAYESGGDASGFKPFFMVSTKSICEKIPLLNEVVAEIICNTVFDDRRRFMEILSETISRMESGMINRGNYFARLRLESYFSNQGKYVENLVGIEFYEFLKGIRNDFDSVFPEVILKLEKVSRSLFNRNNLTINVTSDNESAGYVRTNSNLIIDSLPDDAVRQAGYEFELQRLNEGIITSSQVQFVGKGYGLGGPGFKFTGKHHVLKTIVSLDYLWNKVRVLGGAYGAGVRLERNGNFGLYSYRDPNLKETLDIYDGLPAYLEDFNPTEREMRKFVIGTVGDREPALHPGQKGEAALSYFMKGITSYDLQKEKDEILSTVKEDIRSHADIVRKALEKNHICVFGNEKKINDNERIFGSRKYLFG